MRPADGLIVGRKELLPEAGAADALLFSFLTSFCLWWGMVLLTIADRPGFWCCRLASSCRPSLAREAPGGPLKNPVVELTLALLELAPLLKSLFEAKATAVPGFGPPLLFTDYRRQLG